jgi:hypothetical protein
MIRTTQNIRVSHIICCTRSVFPPVSMCIQTLERLLNTFFRVSAVLSQSPNGRLAYFLISEHLRGILRNVDKYCRICRCSTFAMRLQICAIDSDERFARAIPFKAASIPLTCCLVPSCPTRTRRRCNACNTPCKWRRRPYDLRYEWVMIYSGMVRGKKRK